MFGSNDRQLHRIWDILEVLSQKKLNKTSKFLSFVLRHKPEAIGLVLDSPAPLGSQIVPAPE